MKETSGYRPWLGNNTHRAKGTSPALESMKGRLDIYVYWLRMGVRVWFASCKDLDTSGFSWPAELESRNSMPHCQLGGPRVDYIGHPCLDAPLILVAR
jgi:hypothetical protein